MYKKNIFKEIIFKEKNFEKYKNKIKYRKDRIT